MITTVVPFTPSNVAPFQFSPTLDNGVSYNLSVPWSLYGARFYYTLAALDGTLIITAPLVGSPTGIPLQSLSWSNGFAVATTLRPHGYKAGTIKRLTISGVSPDAFNGLQDCIVTGPSSFSYALAAFPGMVTALGAASYDVNLAAGVVDPASGSPVAAFSSIVFRQDPQQFEVSVPSPLAAAAVASSSAAQNIFTLAQSTLGGPDVLG